MAKKKRATTDAVEILTRRYFAGRKDLDERYEQEAANLEVARKLYELRTRAGLSPGLRLEPKAPLRVGPRHGGDLFQSLASDLGNRCCRVHHVRWLVAFATVR